MLKEPSSIICYNSNHMKIHLQGCGHNLIMVTCEIGQTIKWSTTGTRIIVSIATSSMEAAPKRSGMSSGGAKAIHLSFRRNSSHAITILHAKMEQFRTSATISWRLCSKISRHLLTNIFQSLFWRIKLWSLLFPFHLINASDLQYHHKPYFHYAIKNVKLWICNSSKRICCKALKVINP